VGRWGERATKALAIHPPHDVIAAYTDGSALGNPGPCGAGFVITLDGQVIHDKSIPLGMGDNNLGEMGALLGLLEKLLSMIEAGTITQTKILIFSDSAGCVGYLERGWVCPTDTTVGRSTRSALAKLRRTKQVNVYWIRGHSQVLWNDAADVLAKQGARAAQMALAAATDNLD